MKVGYIRLSKAGPSQRQQRDALRGAGVATAGKGARIYVDGLSTGAAKSGHLLLRERDRLIEDLKKGDVLVVATAGRLGTSPEDVLNALQSVSAKGAAVFDAAAKEQIDLHPSTLPVLAFLERARTEERKQILAQARAKKAELGAHRGPPVKLAGKSLRAAKEAWENLELTVQDVVDLTGVSESTLRRQFGPKGTPRFGRAPNQDGASTRRKRTNRRPISAPSKK